MCQDLQAGRLKARSSHLWIEEQAPTTRGCIERKYIMIPGYHDHEKFAQTHRQNLLREAEHERLLAQLPRSDRNVLRHFMAKSTLFLRSLRARLQKRAKSRKQMTKRAAQ